MVSMIDRGTENKASGKTKRVKKENSGVYIPPGNKDRTGSSSSVSRMQDMLVKVLQRFESTDVGFKELRKDFSSMS
ncbi:hypothetical protein KY289_011286 [Solanum tuberosum]|nr:hypothetical protein KY289_011286 [Solanum tuberosum]